MKKLKFAKPKKVSISKAKAKAWKAFSLYIRTKYASPFGDVICYTCGKNFKIKTVQAGHGIAGRNNAILFEEKLVRCQCLGCNYFGGGKYAIFTRKLIDELGLQEYDRLVTQATQTVKRTAQDYLEIEKTYKEKLRQLS